MIQVPKPKIEKEASIASHIEDGANDMDSALSTKGAQARPFSAPAASFQYSTHTIKPRYLDIKRPASAPKSKSKRGSAITFPRKPFGTKVSDLTLAIPTNSNTSHIPIHTMGLLTRPITPKTREHTQERQKTIALVNMSLSTLCATTNTTTPQIFAKSRSNNTKDPSHGSSRSASAAKWKEIFSPPHYQTASNSSRRNELDMYRSFPRTTMLEFLLAIGKLKRIKRTGWINHNIKEAESIADHMHRMTIIAMSIEDPTIDKSKLVSMAAVHDLAEAVAGDITPHDGISKEDKFKMEMDGINQFKEQLHNSKFSSEIEKLWLEYESGITPEAKLCKDIDKYEMICTAFEYELDGYKGLDSFYESTKDKFQHPELIKMVEELYRKRVERLG